MVDSPGRFFCNHNTQSLQEAFFVQACDQQTETVKKRTQNKHHTQIASNSFIILRSNRLLQFSSKNEISRLISLSLFLSGNIYI